MEPLIHGLILAFGLILPLGVQNIFIFNQGATQKTLIHALPAVLAASFCDSLLILLAVLGVSLIVLQVVWIKTILFGFGCLFLLYIGWVLWKTAPMKTLPNHLTASPPGNKFCLPALSPS